MSQSTSLFALIALALVPGTGGAGAPAPATPQVVMVLSQDADPYREALASFRRTLERDHGKLNFQVVQLQGDLEHASQRLAEVRSADLVLSLGTLATRESMRRFPGTPLVAGMILSPGDLEGAANATGVYLQFPIETELEWLSRLLPTQRRIGVIYHSAENKLRVDRAQRFAAGANLSIHAYRIDGPQELPDALENLADRADVLWGVTDPTVYNPETAKSLLVFSFRHQIPLIGQSTPWVKAGALYALDRDYADIGLQCAEMAEKILAGRAPSSLSPVPPRKVRYALNRRTASQMKLDLPERLFRDAAEVVE